MSTYLQKLYIYSYSFTGNTWSRAWVNLPLGKYNIMWRHRYGLDTKMKTSSVRSMTHSAALDYIEVKKNAACDIIGETYFFLLSL